MLPEDGLINAGNYERAELIEHLETLPKQDELPVAICGDASRPVLSRFACLARKHRMFIVLSLGTKVSCEGRTSRDGHCLHNSQVMFDDGGVLVAAFHKINLYGEKYYDTANETVVYESPFGRLGFSICFDFIWRRPMIDLVEAGVDTIIFSTYWYNWRPFLSSNQEHQAFAIEHDVNVLVANNQIPEEAVYGSGVFQGQRGAIEATMQTDGRPRLIIADLPRAGKASKVGGAKTMRKTIVLDNAYEWEDGNVIANHTQIEHSLLHPLGGNERKASMRQCQGEVCCRLSYQLAAGTDFDSERWTLIVGGQMAPGLGHDQFPVSEQYCALVKCVDVKCREFASTSEVRFEWIELEGNFTINTIYPSVVTSHYQTLPPAQGWRWEKNIGKRKLKLTNNLVPILGVTMYGRDY